MPGGWTGHLKMDSFSSSFSLLVKKVLTALTMIFNFIGKKSSQWYSIFVKKLTMISKSTSVRLCCQHWWKQILEFFANKKSKMDFLVKKRKNELFSQRRKENQEKGFFAQDWKWSNFDAASIIWRFWFFSLQIFNKMSEMWWLLAFLRWWWWLFWHFANFQ